MVCNTEFLFFHLYDENRVLLGTGVSVNDVKGLSSEVFHLLRVNVCPGVGDKSITATDVVVVVDSNVKEGLGSFTGTLPVRSFSGVFLSDKVEVMPLC